MFSTGLPQKIMFLANGKSVFPAKLDFWLDLGAELGFHKTNAAEVCIVYLFCWFIVIVFQK